MAEKCDDPTKNDDLKGTIEIELQDLPIQIAELEIAGFKWRLAWNKKANQCVVACNQDCVDRMWFCRAKYRFQAKENGKWVEWPNQEPSYWFNSDNTLTVSSLRYSSGKCFKATIVKVDIEILWAPHESCFPTFDAILDVKYGNKSKAFHVNRYALAMNSPNYFNNYFFGDWAEKRKKQLNDDGEEMFSIEERADLNLSAFGRMLYLVHFSFPLLENKDLLEENSTKLLLDILVLAVKYTFPMLIHYGEQCLIKRGPGTMEQLVVAEAENLPALKIHCLETLDLIEYGKNFKENIPLLASLSKPTIDLLDKRIKETAERYSRKRKLLESEDTVAAAEGPSTTN